MAYSTSSDIQSDFKNITFSTTTLVTSDDVEQFIDEADALIDSYLGMRFQVPVEDDDSALNLLKMFSRTLVADRIKKILEVKQTTNQSANQDIRGAYSTKDVLQQLRDIRDGNLNLSGATSLVSGGGFYSNNYTNDVTPIFTKNDKAW